MTQSASYCYLMLGRVILSNSLTELMFQLQNNNIQSSEHKAFDISEVGYRLGWPTRGCLSASNTLINYHKHNPHEQPIVLNFNEVELQLTATLTYRNSIISTTRMKEITAMFSKILDSLCIGKFNTPSKLLRAIERSNKT
ncbi:hypothetical protein GQ44DRAFT_722942 [Phaeosphaeriaceae sp. PMI808]|nr:hypothetical protein GQ44DRAFT_722942 [Phaeosphaeriaceae sp. PMI808]